MKAVQALSSYPAVAAFIGGTCCAGSSSGSSEKPVVQTPLMNAPTAGKPLAANRRLCQRPWHPRSLSHLPPVLPRVAMLAPVVLLFRCKARNSRQKGPSNALPTPSLNWIGQSHLGGGSSQTQRGPEAW